MNNESLWQWCNSSLCLCVPGYSGEEAGWSSLRRILNVIHAYHPNIAAVHDFATIDAAKWNSQKIFQTTETRLGIPCLLDHSETTNFDSTDSHLRDDLSYFTYLAILHFVLKNSKTACPSIKFALEECEPVAQPTLTVAPQHFLWCHYCQKDVLLAERFLINGKVSHRQCFSCRRCGKLLHVGLYRASGSDADNDFECSEHEKDDLATELRCDREREITELKVVDLGITENPAVFAPKDMSAEIAASGLSALCDTDIPDLAKQLLLECVQEGSSTINDETNNESHLLANVTANNDQDPAPESEAKFPTAPPRRKKPDNSAKSVKPTPAVRNKLKNRSPGPGYPEEKNPFGDEEDDPPTVVAKKSQPPVSSQRSSLSTNPFSSDAADFYGSASSLSSDNPFNDSDHDDGLLESSIRRRSMLTPANLSNGLGRCDLTKSFTARVSASKNVQLSSDRSPNMVKKRPAPPAPPVDRPKSTIRKKRPAPPPPLPFRRQIRSEIAMSAEEVASQLASNDEEVAKLAAEGRLLEDRIRGAPNADQPPLLAEWLALVERRTELTRRESELAFLYRERQLDDLHTEIEYQLRCIIEKPESEKKADDGQREARLLKKLLAVIDEKSRLAESDISDKKSPDQQPTPSDFAEKETEVKKKKHKKLRLKKLKKKFISS